MSEPWHALPATAQDLALVVALLAPVAAALAPALGRRGVGAVVRALVVRHAAASALFVTLIGLAVGIGLAVLVQERALRAGSAHAADAFDVLVTAPGSDVTAMLAAVYLDPAALPLVPAERWAAVAAHPATDLAAPLAFGDSVDGAPIVGTTAAFVAHLLVRSGAGIAAGRPFVAVHEALVGSATDFAPGQRLVPAHGVGFVEGAHAHAALTVVGRLAPTGTPWDRAVVVPIESVWIAHGLGDGRAATADGVGEDRRDAASSIVDEASSRRRAEEGGEVAADARDDGGGEAAPGIGPPWDVERMPGVPAIVARAEDLGGNYALRGAFTDTETMAFFPGEVLARLHALLGDLRRVLSLLALVTQLLVVTAVAAALAILMRGFARRFAMLRALGAPAVHVFAIVWSHGTLLVLAGAALGVGVGLVAARVLSALIAAETGVAMPLRIASADAVPLAAFVLVGAALATLPAWAAARREPVAALRG